MKTILVLITTFISLTGFGQTKSLVTGIWKGTSLCQAKGSPCHDENVVYHISKKNLNSYEILMNKIVNNKEEEMGTIIFEYDTGKQTLTSIDTARNAQWIFKLEGKRMKGTLVYKGNLYRIIIAKKED